MGSFGLAVLSGLAIAIFQWYRYVFFVGAAILLFFTFQDQVAEINGAEVSKSIDNAKRIVYIESSTATGPKTKAEKVRDISLLAFERFCFVVRCLENVWLRTPDNLDLEHRYVD